MRELRLHAAVFFALFSTACPEDQIGMAHGRLVVAPERLDFGVVPIAELRMRTLELSNNGDAALEVTPSILGANIEGLRVELTALTIIPGEKKTLEVAYVPEVVGALIGEIKFTTDSALTPEVRVPVNGNAIASPFSVEPKNIDFGNVRRGRTASQNIVIKNLIDEPITISLGNIEGSNAEDFRIGRPSSTFELEANAEATVEVSFAPAVLGLENARFDVEADCNVSCRERVVLSGVGVESTLSCTPAAIDFRAITPGSCVTRSVTCENPETRSTSIVELTIEESAPEMSVRTVAPIDVPGGASRDIEVDYCPTDLGPDSGRLKIVTREIDGDRGMLSIELEGEGGGPDISVSPSNLVFGAAIGNLHVRRALIENTGFTALEVRNFRIEPAEAPYRVVRPSLPYYVQPAEAELLEIEFAPAVIGQHDAELIIDSNDGDEPEVRITLRGSALDAVPCEVTIAPSELNYGLVQVGGAYTRQITLRSAGSNRCAFFEPRLENGSIYRFGAAPPESGMIEPGVPVSFDIVYEPTVGSPISGDDDAFLVEIPNETPSSIRIPIHGLAAPSDLVVYPNPIDFGQVRINYPRMRTLTLYNVGSNLHHITALARAPGSSLDFSMTSTPALPLTLSPGTSIAIDLNYRSPDVGTDQASLAITSDALPGPILVDLRGIAGDDDCGDITGIICSPDGESPVVGAQVIIETAAGDTIETRTDENGAYYLYCVPPGRVDVNFGRGHFRGRTTTTVVAHQTTVVEEPTCLEAGSANIAVIAGNYDHVEDILSDLGIPHEVHQDAQLLNNFSMMQAYDIIFMNCGMDDSQVRNPVVAANIRQFIAGGGSMYASDFAYDSVEGSFPMQVDYAGDDTLMDAAQQGFVSPLESQVIDTAILARLGGQADVTLTLAGGYAVMDAAAPTTLVHVVGEVLGPGTGLRPLLVSFQPTPDSGKFVYTSFHNADVFLDPGMRIVLEYLVFEL